MGLNEKPASERVHIAFFGLRNAGKSSVVNAVTNQQVSLVSDIKGTTTDPVFKTMELLPLGPVVIIDTPGTDDEGKLGDLRVKRAKEVLNKTDIAVLVVDSQRGITEQDSQLITLFKEKEIKYITVYNKSDLLENIPESGENQVYVSAKSGDGINKLKELIGTLTKQEGNNRKIVADLINPKDIVVLVTPIDSAAPKGRLILPQQQTIRDILDIGATAVVTRETELAYTLNALAGKPKMVITDSQVFDKVNKVVPKDVPLTSFSILFARYKGDLKTAVEGAAYLKNIKDGDLVLISEGCTHHRQCGDIGTVKLPNWIREYTKSSPTFKFTSGGDFPENLAEYSLIIHCGGCMLTEKEMKYRQGLAKAIRVPITNYGIAIAQMHGILLRSVEMFPDIAGLLK